MEGVQNLRPGILRGRDVRLPVQCNMRERISVQELHRPVQQADQAAENAESDHADDVAVLCALLSRHTAYLSQTVDDRHDQTAKANRAETVRQGTLQRAPRRPRREVVHAEIP